MSVPDELRRLARELRQRLDVNRRFGWDVPLARRALQPELLQVVDSPDGLPADDAAPEIPSPAEPAAAGAQQAAAVESVLPSAAGQDIQVLLEPIRQRVAVCTACPLHSGRTNTVFGVGDPHAALMFVGEGPGYDEDRQGEPFVGKAGMLLDRMIRAMGLEREQVYIANVVKCRPPKNRTPAPEEISACRGYLEQQIAIVKPRVIVALGATAARALLGGVLSMARMRARFHDYHGAVVMPTYHPAYLLRYPEEKRKVWDDLQQVMNRLGP